MPANAMPARFLVSNEGDAIAICSGAIVLRMITALRRNGTNGAKASFFRWLFAAAHRVLGDSGQAGRIKAVDAGESGVFMRQVEGKRPQVASRGQPSGLIAYF